MVSRKDELTFRAEVEAAINQDKPIYEIQSAKKDKIEKYCREKYGMTYKEVCTHRKIERILYAVICENATAAKILETYFNDGTEMSQLYRLLINKATPMKKIKKHFLGGTAMSKTEAKEKELLVLQLLAGSKRMTYSAIAQSTGMSKAAVCVAIKKLREDFVIVSVPGRYQGGFLLNDKIHRDYSERWINNIRRSFGLAPSFRYAT